MLVEDDGWESDGTIEARAPCPWIEEESDSDTVMRDTTVSSSKPWLETLLN